MAHRYDNASGYPSEAGRPLTQRLTESKEKLYLRGLERLFYPEVDCMISEDS